jgi:hypothetical protein
MKHIRRIDAYVSVKAFENHGLLYCLSSFNATLLPAREGKSAVCGDGLVLNVSDIRANENVQ